MAVSINARGTSYPNFQIGDVGATVFQGPTQPAGMSDGDIWIDTTLGSVKVFKGTSTDTYRFGGIEVNGNTISAQAGDLILSPQQHVKIGAEYAMTSTSPTPGTGWTTNELPEGTLNLYHTTARARSAISVTTAGLGSMSYTPSTGVIAYSGPSTINLGTDTTGNYVATLTSGTGIALAGTAKDPIVSVNAEVVRTAIVNQTVQGTKIFTDARGSVNPTQALGFATKQYVDNISSGLDTKQSVRVATTTSITLSGTQTVDGVALAVGNRVLVKDQGTAANGIYDVQTTAWSRSTDADNTPLGEVTSGMYTFVEEGIVNISAGFTLQTPDPILLGTTVLTFVQFSGAGQFIAGNGLGKTANTLFVNASNGVTLVADNVEVDGTVIRTSGPQTLADTKTFTSPIIVSSSANTTLQLNKTAGATNNIAFGAAATFGIDGAGVASWISNGGILSLHAANDLRINNNKLLSTLNEGHGNGIDADTVDGIEGANIVLRTGNQTVAGIKTFSDNITLSKAAGNAALSVNSVTGSSSLVLHNTGTVNRWSTGKNAADTHYEISRYNNTGTLQGTPLSINRSTGVTNFETMPTAAGSPLLLSSTAASSYVSLSGDTLTGNLAFGNTNGIGGLQHVQLTNTEEANHSATPGRIAFDENYASTFRWDGSNGGGLAVYNEDGWGALLSTSNIGFYSANFANLTIASSQVITEANFAAELATHSHTHTSLHYLGVAKATVTATGLAVVGIVDASSDATLKKDVTTYANINATDIRAVNFKWKDSTLGTQTVTGYIAQEVEKVLPDAVRTNEEGIKSVNYDAVHTAKIAELESQVKELKELVTKLMENK